MASRAPALQGKGRSLPIVLLRPRRHVGVAALGGVDEDGGGRGGDVAGAQGVEPRLTHGDGAELACGDGAHAGRHHGAGVGDGRGAEAHLVGAAVDGEGESDNGAGR